MSSTESESFLKIEQIDVRLKQNTYVFEIENEIFPFWDACSPTAV